MPIAAMLPALQSQLVSALSNDKGAMQPIVAMQIGSAIASIAPSGIFPPFPPMPLVPAGVAGGISMIQNAMSMQQGATKKTVAQMIGVGVSMIAPMAPPVGLSVLQQQIESAFSLDKGAQKQAVATLIASAIITYYTMGGVL